MASLNLYKKKLLSLTSFHLKVIACISMFIDHFGYMVVYHGILYGYDAELFRAAVRQPEGMKWMIVYRICRVIGRLAFPIFCYTLVEGFYNTRNLTKYILRILFFAIITEIPINLVVNNSLWWSGYQNVLWTLLIGLICMGLCERLKQTPATGFLKIIIFSIGGFIAWKFKTDYDYQGIILIFIFYFFRREKMWMYLFATVMCFLMTYKLNYGSGVISILLISCYNQKKGFPMPKYFFYLFYPIHLFVLYMIVWIPSYLRNLP